MSYKPSFTFCPPFIVSALTTSNSIVGSCCVGPNGSVSGAIDTSNSGHISERKSFTQFTRFSYGSTNSHNVLAKIKHVLKLEKLIRIT